MTGLQLLTLAFLDSWKVFSREVSESVSEPTCGNGLVQAFHTADPDDRLLFLKDLEVREVSYYVAGWLLYGISSPVTMREKT